MTAREWQPGDVAMAERDNGAPFMVVRTAGSPDYWSAPRVWPSGVSSDSLRPRPLVVIDPEDREQVERLVQAWERQTGESAFSNTGRYLQAALREFANPTPPRPEEPTGLGAVVEADFVTEDGKGFGPAHWAKAGDGSWVCLTDGHARSGTAWPFLSNVRVLSGGVS